MTSDGDLRRLFRRHLPQVDFVAVETGRTGRGVPDVNYCVAGCEGWIELKEARGFRIRVSPEQVGWAERRISRGGRVLVAVRKGDLLLMYGGDRLRYLKQVKITSVDAIAGWDGGPSRWDWEHVLAILMAGG